jgi:hypothetical protein
MADVIRRAVEKANIFKYPNVVGHSNKLMPRIRRGVIVPEEQCVRIYVSKKLPEPQLKPSEIIPKTVKLDDGREVCTDVVEIGRIRKIQQLDPKQRWRPSPAGVSTGRADESATGTLGWFMVDENGEVYAISNNHVWAKENQGTPGDLLVQPGLLDGGDPERDVLFELFDFVPIDFAGGYNKVDVAVAKILNFSNVYMSILNIGGVTGKRLPGVGETVTKMGRSTGLTRGGVIDDSATVVVEYTAGIAKFTDVFIAEGSQIINPGDSGSPVLTSDGKFAGLVFAGNDKGTDLVACKYTHIESELASRINRKIWVLVVNSYPPFFREREVQVVYRDTASSILVLGVTMLMMVSIYGSLREAYRSIYSK